MEYYRFINLPFLSELKQNFIAVANEYISNNKLREGNHCFFKDLDSNSIKIINLYFIDKGLSAIHPLLWFFRFKDLEVSSTKVHLDGLNTRPYASIVLPIIGCQNTFQYWYDGEFTRDGSTQAAVAGGRVKWLGEPKLVARADTSVDPILSRVDIPHGAVSNDTEIRVTCTIRFKKNFTYEEISQRLSS